MQPLAEKNDRVVRRAWGPQAGEKRHHRKHDPLRQSQRRSCNIAGVENQQIDKVVAQLREDIAQRQAGLQNVRPLL